MDITPLIVLGYERDRHIAGLHLLMTKKSGSRIQKAYIAFSDQDPYKAIALENVKYIHKIASLILPEAKIEKLPFDSFSLQHIAEMISYVIEKEKDKGEVWIDLTSTTKEVISLSTFFTLFGVRIYWVTSPLVKGETRIKQRIMRTFKSLKETCLNSLIENLALNLEEAKTKEERSKLLSEFFQDIVKEYLEATMEEYRNRKGTGLAELPIKTVEKKHTLLRSIKLRDIHKKLLMDLQKGEATLKDLQDDNKELSQMAIRYALANLHSIGFLSARRRKYSLTKIGLGYAAGIKKARNKS